ncbi:hypothetical protein [Mucisphaera calidilacus]|uniref:PEP-CTERM protein-sorting domain-containing protein n=1 Tax=Mucisphaera calidilacus TaxID=2527982 RepID=A0A518BX33_9BACT|nr:hypothetical protein [Mucisphaera calidilacus]QDU71529.1 hypothetical protein Pan265_13790 [Mucisphaera calidilacus]
MTNRKTALWTIAALFTGSTASAAILSDAFDRTLGNANPDNGALLSDWGSNDNGLGGSTVQAYALTPTRVSGGGINSTVQDGQGVIRFGAASTAYDLTTDPAVLAAGGYVVNVDVTRGSSGFASIFFGLDAATVAATDGGAAFLAVNAVTDATFLIQSNQGAGRVQWNTFGGGSINFDNIAGFDDATAQVNVEVKVEAPDGFDALDPITISIAVNGTPVTTQNFITDGEGLGYVGFSANTGGAMYDNLVISALPEPMSASLLALGGLALLRRRG